MNWPLSSAALPCRTYLFVPGDRPERFDKAWQSPADAVILDLEDGVAPERKGAAREAVAGWLRPDRPVWVRCNAADTPWFADDLALLSRPGVAGVVMPKAEVLPQALLDAAVRYRLGVIPLIETAQGIDNAQALARQSAVVRLAFGALDFQVDLGIDGDDDALLYFRSQLVLASRLANKPSPIDGITPSIDDTQALQHDTRRAQRLGFGARLCIHPRQVEAIHERLAPAPEVRRWAERVVAALDAAAAGVATVDGKMVDRPVLLRARAVLATPAADQCLRG